MNEKLHVAKLTDIKNMLLTKTNVLQYIVKYIFIEVYLHMIYYISFTCTIIQYL